MRIIVDAMGGDHSPNETVKGICLAAKEFTNVEFTVVGDKSVVESLIRENGCDPSRFEICHADEVVEMTDDPMVVVRGKKNSSMNLGLTLLSEKKGDAFVSCGNTGALFTGATLIVHKIKGVQRAAIATVLPLACPVLLIDSGANSVVNEESVEQFAVMGSAYMEKVFGITNPRVGLLNNGAEEHKGTPLAQSCHKRLAELPGINFVGNVEANSVTKDVCDVLVTDGFTGNVFLKAVEGVSKLFSAEIKSIFKSNLFSVLSYLGVKKHFTQFKKKYDPKEKGGAPLVGLCAPVIKAHGSSDAVSFKNAIKQAMGIVENDTLDLISERMAVYTDYRKERRKQEKEKEVAKV